MPYIKSKDRAIYVEPLSPLLDELKQGDWAPGELNYVITMIVGAALGDVPGYGTMNEIIGVLECVKLELYRRIVAPYEDNKIIENGDVY